MAYIAYQQHKLDKLKVKNDFHERRYAIYSKIRDLMIRIVNNLYYVESEDTTKNLYNYCFSVRNEIQECVFLCDEDTKKYINRIFSYCDSYVTNNKFVSELKKDSEKEFNPDRMPTPTTETNYIIIEKTINDKILPAQKWLYEQLKSGMLEEKMKKYLTLKNL